MYTLRFAKSAEKVIARMPQGVARRMIDELKAIATDPTMYRGDWKPLVRLTLLAFTRRRLEGHLRLA